jgi:hypothetical protein
MSFYIFRFEKLFVKHKRGNVPDDDVVTFAVMINQTDRGHATGFFPAMATNTTVTTDDIAPEGWLAFPARNATRNTTASWQVGPLETDPGDDVSLVCTGFNTSDSGLSSLGTQKQDELEIKILNIVAKKFVGLILGAGFGDDIGSALSEAFNDYFEDPIGDLIGYKRQGPCNGPVFVGAERFHGSDLDGLAAAPLWYTLYPGTPYPKNVVSEFPGTRLTFTYTDEASHDTNVCGHVAETDVTFSICRVPFISLRTWVPRRFPYPDLGKGLRKLGPPDVSFGIKSLLGVKP